MFVGSFNIHRKISVEHANKEKYNIPSHLRIYVGIYVFRTHYDQLKLSTRKIFKCDYAVKRMAGVFDIELHDGDSINQDESDDDIVENKEVRFLSNLMDFESLYLVSHVFRFF